ncbi:ubiquitin carboxyl-terminal hydrolase 6-like [Juglans regia]|uniref:Ubiquitin carboxyl-terminal hydrolase n=1 Tax=Juglans regia TaxID=51240 RepID=A0A6P9EGP7_JUGRE|nr:ubiquitin carboxyl-terminal hydrolase 6-like [Juglans regia]
MAHNVNKERITVDLMATLSSMYEKPYANNKVHLMTKLFNLKMSEDIEFDDEIRSLIILSSLPNSWDVMRMAPGKLAKVVKIGLRPDTPDPVGVVNRPVDVLTKGDFPVSDNCNVYLFTVNVKWQKELFKDVEIDTTQSPNVFKCQLYDLTGVPPVRQKIMVKGGLLKDDGDWSTLGVKEGQKLMMMGTADEIIKAPEKGPVFVEDLPEEEQVVAMGHSAGLFNLGNTCYMNSTVQCLHSVPELKSALVKYSHSGRSNDVDQSSHMLTIATRDLFNELDKSVKPVAPMQFWMVLRKKYPQFGQLHNGVFMQQDAEECWTQLLYTLSQSLKSTGSSEIPDTMKALFGIELVSRVHCQESGEESSETESVYSLKCHISQEVNHLHEGLKHGLKSELEKASPSLGRSAIYLKESRINGLPRYLTVQFVRFFWKRESNQKAKILRKVDYPLELDVYDLCSDDLRKRLETPRQVLRDEEGKKLGLKASKDGVDGAGSKDDVKMSNVEGSSNVSGEPSNATSQEGGPSDRETHMTGVYDLVAVLTHKGRSADSGHYVAWVKQESGKWIEYDDDNPIAQREEDITKLSGGGDWHMAYICMYKARVVPM